MNQILPHTKFHTPEPTRAMVERPGLTERLEQGLCGRVTLVSAPPGFGKSSLVAQWVSNCPYPHVWLSLDDGDSDPQSFLRALIAALQTEQPELGASVQGVLSSPQPIEPVSILTDLLNELTQRSTPLVLVLDDYHRVRSTEVDRALTFWVEHQPAPLHLVLVSREDPALPLPQWRARGWLNELRQASLRFSVGEAEVFLKQSLPQALPDSIVATLTERTEGWVAGLQMAAVALQSESSPAHWLDEFNGRHHFVMDYLMDEVLRAQPAELQQFLIQTGFLSRLNGPLCDTVLGHEPGIGQAWLEHIERSNLFLNPLDSQRHWYRYHHLFAELLCQQADSRRNHAVEPLGIRSVRASEWFEQQGDVLEAFHYAVMAKDTQRAYRLAENQGAPLYMRGAAKPVLDWLRGLPAAVMDSNPALWVMLATVVSVSGRNTELDAVLERAETCVRRWDDHKGASDWIGRLAALRAIQAAPKCQIDIVQSNSEAALSHLADHSVAMRAQATWSLGIAQQLKGSPEQAAKAFQTALTLSEQSGNDFVRNLAGTGLAQCREAGLQLFAAERLYRALAEVPPSRRLPSACEACFGLARVLYQWNRLEEAETWLEEGVRLAAYIEQIDSVWTMRAFQVRLSLAQGRFEVAFVQLKTLSDRLKGEGYPLDWPPLREAEAWLASKTGKGLTGLNSIGDPLWSARQALAHKEWQTVLSDLDSVGDIGCSAEAEQSVQRDLLVAVALRGVGQHEPARQRLQACLSRTEPGSLLRLYLDEGPLVQEALLDLQQSGHRSIHLLTLLEAFEAATAEAANPEAHPALIEPLTRRECSVLALMAEGLSNQDIGDRLCLALSTVKGYNRAIFDKLQVRRRTEAVAKARDLGLL